MQTSRSPHEAAGKVARSLTHQGGQMTRRLRETITAIAASATLALLCGGPAEAATAPVSNPRVIAHLDAAEGQTPEDVAVEPDGPAHLSLSQAHQVAHVSLNRHLTPPPHPPPS